MADTATALGAGHEITVTRTFDAPVALVYACFTDAERFAKWWGPAGCQNIIHAFEPKPGGDLSLTMSGPGFSHTMGGQFVELDPPRRLVFRSMAFEAPDGGWGIVNRITLTFEERDGATVLTSHTLVEKAAGELVLGALGGLKTGWGQSLERLGDLVGGGGKLDVEVGDRRLVLTRAFDAPRERLWEALTDPGQFERWWCAGGGKVEEMDLRPGGKWSLRQTTPDGGSHLFWGEYKEIDPPSRLAMTQGFDQYPAIDVVHVLTEEWGRTVLTRTMTFPDNTYRDGMIQSGVERGTAQSYDTLAEVLAGV
jgi:uncharacterized protein YndB with AHSA1/START domain